MRMNMHHYFGIISKTNQPINLLLGSIERIMLQKGVRDDYCNILNH